MTGSTRRRNSQPRLLLLASAMCLAIAASMSAQSGASRLRADEDVMLFPTNAVEAGGGAWTADVHGWIFERGRQARGIGVLEKALRERYGLRKEELGTAVFRQRAAMFSSTTSGTNGWRLPCSDPASPSHRPSPAATCTTESRSRSWSVLRVRGRSFAF
jgi:hypothetical protein